MHHLAAFDAEGRRIADLAGGLASSRDDQTRMLAHQFLTEHRALEARYRGALEAFAADGLQRLLAEPYLHQPPPKSTGRDLFNPSWLEQHLRHCPSASAADVQATLLELTASACAASATSYHSCSAAPLPWPSAFSWAAHVFKAGRSLLAFGSNSAVKRTRILRAAYLGR